MKISVRSASPTSADADLVVLGVFSTTSKKGPSSPALDALDKELGGALSAHMKSEEFTGKRDQCLVVPTFGAKTLAKKIALLGLGAKENSDAEARTFSARAARLANHERATSLVAVVPDGWESRMRALAEGVELGAYRFTKYMTGDRVPKKSVEWTELLTTRKVSSSAKKEIDLGQAIAHGVNVARDLSNEPPNNLFPEDLAAAAKKEGKKHGFGVKVFDHDDIQKKGMLLLHAVGRGSTHGPRLVHMSYVPKKAKKKVCFVGKGITFDTGGISIKPAQGMEWMKHDMSGAANMVGLMIAVAEAAPKVEVHALMACAENMPDGNAYRPGDIWGSYDGKTVEIINTDAEGRLVLADALAYAAKDIKPDLLIDNATLTGAVVVALGNNCSAFYATNDNTASEFWKAIRSSGEPIWRMPLLQDLRDQIRSDVADIKHVGDRWGGSIVGALFLREFIGEIENWVHVDIAGPAATDKSWSWHGKGATGHGVLTFLALVEKLGGK